MLSLYASGVFHFLAKRTRRAVILTARVRVLYFVNSMMFSMLGFSLISAIIVTANCGFSYSVWIDDGSGCGGHVSSGFLSHGGP